MSLKFAFFDLDETLIRIKSLLHFYDFYLAQLSAQQDGSLDRLRSAEEVKSWLSMQLSSGIPRDKLNRAFYERYFCDLSIDYVTRIASLWFSLLDHESLLNQPVVAVLKKARVLGYIPVIVTGSFREVTGIVASHLRIEQYLCAPLEEKQGRYTGRLVAPPTIGEGKRMAVLRFLEDQGGNAQRCIGFGDDLSDLPFLQVLGAGFYVGTEPAADHQSNPGEEHQGDVNTASWPRDKGIYNLNQFNDVERQLSTRG